MPNYYVDLDLTTSGGAGNINDPFNYTDLVSKLGETDSDGNYYIRGKKESASDAISVETNTNNVYFYAWDVDTYGPWRLKVDSIASDPFECVMYFYDCILSAGTTGVTRFDSCFVYGEAQTTQDCYVINSSFIDPIVSDPIGDEIHYSLFTEGSWEAETDISLNDSILESSAVSDLFTSNFGVVTSSNVTLNGSYDAVPDWNEIELEKFSLGQSAYGVGRTWAATPSKYYADLSLETNGGVGLSGAPYSWDDLNSITPISYPVYLKGAKVFTSAITNDTSLDFNPWDLWNYGPWRMYSDDSISLSATSADGCIISASSVTLNKSSDCYIYANENITYAGTIVNKSYFDCKAIDFLNLSSELIQFQDCYFGYYHVSGYQIDLGSDLSADFTSCYSIVKEIDDLVSVTSAVSSTDINYDQTTYVGDIDPNTTEFSVYDINSPSWAYDRTFYVDLSASTRGIGTESNPWSLTDFREYLSGTYVSSTSGDTIVRDYDTNKLKGTVTTNNTVFLPNYLYDKFKQHNVKLEAWNLPTYGPWKVLNESVLGISNFSIYDKNQGRNVTFIVKDAFISNMFIQTHEDVSADTYAEASAAQSGTPPYGYVNYKFQNCTFSGDISFNNETYSADFEEYPDEFDGCTFVDGTFYLHDAVLYYQDEYGIADVRENLDFNDCVSFDYFFDFSDAFNLHYVANSATIDDLVVSADEIEMNFCQCSGASADIIDYQDYDPYGESFAGGEHLTLSGCVFDITPLKDYPGIDRLLPIYKNVYRYGLYGVSATSTDRSSVWDSNDYNYGLFGETRLGPGALYFSDISTGHIGAFYFGPLDETVTPSPIIISATLVQPDLDFSSQVSASVIVPKLDVIIQLKEPRVYSFQDISIDFTGTPLSGPSPLVVQFDANVTFGGAYKYKYKVSQYQWCFNYDSDGGTCSEDWVYTTDASTIHTYRGYSGQKYDVRLCVLLELL